MNWSFASVCQQTHPVSLKAISDPHLAPIDYIIISNLSSCGPYSCQVKKVNESRGPGA